ncbi:hypothetical protein IE53DRAFT_389097 [Violaceomyces palustris]|uniref:Uncharacterized protein n=1 Tax=Violaceomyces palustris TaxID=1673888 RepID=A0ACD0NS72_9BASI|nr:hypothetical protein IE53DRAFT_389097 [Violaceomyces palustris]
MPPIGTMITSIIACRAFRGLLEAHESRITTEPKVVNLTESNGSSLKRIIKPWVIGKFSKSRGPYRKNAEALPWRLQGSDPNDLGTGVNLDLDLNPNTFVVDFLRAPAGSPGVGSAKSTSGGKSDLLVGEVISNHLLRNEDSFFCRGDDDSIFGDDSTCSFSYGEGFLDGGLRMERTVSDASSDLSLMVSNAKGMEGKDISSFFPLTPSRERFRKESCDLQGTRTRIDVDHRSICVSPHAVFSTGSISPRSSRYRTERDPGKPAPNELLRSRSTCSSKKIFSHREFMFVAQPSYHSVAEECLGQRGRSSSISARQSFRPESVVFVLASAKEEGKESLKQEKGNGLDEDFGSSYHPPAAVPSDACSTVNAAAPLMVPNLEHHHPMPKRQAVRESLHNYSRPRPRPRPWSVDTEDPKSPGLFHKVKMKKSPISFRNPFSVTGMDAIEESGLESQEVEKDGFGGGGESRIPGRGGCQDERALLQVEDEKMESKMGFEAEGEPPEESIDSAAQASTQSDAYGRKTPKRCGSPTEAVVGWWSKPGSMSHRRKTAQVLDGSQGSCLKVVEEGQKGKSLLKHLSDPRSKPVGEDRLDSSTMTIMDRERGGEEESIPPDSTVSPHVVVGKANVSKPPRPLRIRGKMRRVEEEEEKEGRGGRTSSAVMTDSIPRKRMSEGDDGGSRPPIAREEKMTVERGEQKDPSLEEPRERGSEVAKGRWESGKSRSPDAIVPRSGNERDVGGGRSSGWKGEGIRLKVTSSYGPDVERGGDKYYEIQRIERGLESQLSSYDEVQTQSGGDLGREDRWRTSMEGWPSLGGAKRRSTGGGNDPKLSQLPEDVSGSSVDSISGRL